MLPPTIYVVQRVQAYGSDHDNPSYQDYRTDPMGKPLKAFLDPNKAEAYRQSLEKKLRTFPYRSIFPFQHGTALQDFTTMPAEVLHDWLLDAGLTPPPLDGLREGCLSGWWRRNVDRFTPQQYAHVWQALDRIALYKVTPLELRED
jgi:hypothetical protein